MDVTSPILVTGGAGFIGSHFVRAWLADAAHGKVINLDALTYAGNLENLAEIAGDTRYHFMQGDINDRDLLQQILQQFQPGAIVHFAAETHVDRSIAGPEAFLHTNMQGTFTLLEAAKEYWLSLPTKAQQNFRFLHISTDEVFGALEPDAPAFTEDSPYQPNSPYAATKAAADHLVRAWHATYGLPTIISHCSNNYGPNQYPEKLIPHMITLALKGEKLPIFGDGLQIRDWLYVADHVAALQSILQRGKVGESYVVGGHNEHTNLALVQMICDQLDGLAPPASRGLNITHYRELIAHVEDRAGHDRRYAINPQKIQSELGWQPQQNFLTGLETTIRWYLQSRGEND